MKRLLLKPEIYLHTLALIFAFIITLCIASVTHTDFNNGESNEAVCVFSGDASSCVFAKVSGVSAMTSNIFSLFVCVCIEITVSVAAHRIVSFLSLTHNLCLGFLWFLVFCVLANKWSLTADPPIAAVGAAQCAMAFSFLSLPLYALINTVLLIRTIKGPGSICDAGFYRRFFSSERAYARL